MPEIPVALQIQPEFRAGPECFTRRQRRIRTDLTTANHIVEARAGPAEVCGKGLPGQTMATVDTIIDIPGRHVGQVFQHSQTISYFAIQNNQSDSFQSQ